jgi:hypothetical protein
MGEEQNRSGEEVGMRNRFEVSMDSPEEVQTYREIAKMQGFASIGAMARYALMQYSERYKLEEKLLRRFAVQRAAKSEKSEVEK